MEKTEYTERHWTTTYSSDKLQSSRTLIESVKYPRSEKITQEHLIYLTRGPTYTTNKRLRPPRILKTSINPLLIPYSRSRIQPYSTPTFKPPSMVINIAIILQKQTIYQVILTRKSLTAQNTFLNGEDGRGVKIQDSPASSSLLTTLPILTLFHLLQRYMLCSH